MREILSWIPGMTVTTGQEIDLPELARMVRSLHDLTAGYVPGRECVIHDDLQPRERVADHEQALRAAVRD